MSNIENIRKELVGKRVEIIRETTVMIFKRVTDIIEAQVALQDPEIRSGARNNLLYVIEGFAEKSSNEYIYLDSIKGEKIMMYVYPDSIISYPIDEEKPVTIL